MNEPIAPPPPPAGSPPPTGNMTQQVQGPAIGLIVTAALGIVLALISLLSNLMGAGMAGMGDLGGELDEYSRYLTYMSGGVGILFALIQLGVSGFIIWAALQMKDLRNWTLAVTASILAMIPCIGPCCLIGIPIGIWSLVVLMKPEVKTAFTG